MEPVGSAPRSQKPATCPYLKPDESIPHPSLSVTPILILSYPLRLGFPTKTLYVFLLSPLLAIHVLSKGEDQRFSVEK
jgi:hypothetical protein